ncbi:glycosyl transferase [Pedobacter heparinus]|uniref:glycosyl transferase n=1 Tax=Pedobacter heparinus TaxID=984 RepID=UPI00292D5A6C|nr:glycosyl transferase [Pedobacter heparinus]
MLKFCTLFNSAYLSRGLAMYHSLAKHCDDFHLYIVAFDEDCCDALLALQLKHVSVIALKDFENEALLAVKMGRTPTEYCWTCSSSTIKYCIETYQLDHCTYVDADLLFFNNPKVLYEEMGDQSVLITSHRFTPCFDQSATSGIYCVQYLTFKNTAEGMTALNWWVDACLEWCFCKMEDNKFGDQKYLDDWTTRFKGVHVLEHLGGGVAPWNIQQYSFKLKGGKVRGTALSGKTDFDLIFYHYHAFAYTWNNSYRLTDETYPLTKSQIKLIYKPFVLALLKAETEVEALGEHVRAYKRTEEGIWINRVIGRALVFFLRGFYKQYYSKRFFQYGIFN